MPPLRTHHGRGEYRPGRGHVRILRQVGGGVKKQMVVRSLSIFYQTPSDHKMKSSSIMVEKKAPALPGINQGHLPPLGRPSSTSVESLPHRWTVGLLTDGPRLRDFLRHETAVLFKVMGNWKEENKILD